MQPVKIDGVYYAFWTCVQGYCELHAVPKRHKGSLHTGDKREALDRCADLARRLEQERARVTLGLAPVAKSNMLLSEYVTKYRERTAHDKAKTTQETEKYHVATFLAYTGDRPLSHVTSELCQQYKLHRLKSVAPRSWNSELTTLRAMFNHGLTWHPKPFEVSPFAGVTRVEKGVPTVEKYVSPSDIAKADGDPFWLNCLEFLRITWCRGGELRGLKWSDVYYDAGFLEFRAPKERRVKRLPLTRSLVACLAKAKELRGSSVYVFPHIDGSMMTKLTLYRGISRLGYSAGVKLSPHMLRHSGITNALAAGANVFAVQQVAGHSQVTTTQGYEHTDLRMKQAAMDAVPPRRGPGAARGAAGSSW